MVKKFTPKIITANDLIDGEAVYFTASNNWSKNHFDAIIANSNERAKEILSKAQEQQSIIVGVYMADIILNNEKISFMHFRETFRSIGPSNYFHGKQENFNTNNKVKISNVYL